MTAELLASARANLPRWRGQPGFFEIWFFVLFEPRVKQAYWFRYTTFAPRDGSARATVWAAAFDAVAPPVAGKALYARERYSCQHAAVRTTAVTW